MNKLHAVVAHALMRAASPLMATLVLSVASAAVLLANTTARTFTGVITDSMCGTDHEHMNAGPDPDCVKSCIKSGNGQYKYVLFDGKKNYKLSDQATPEKFAAKKVKVTGTLYEKTGVIKVDKIEVAK
jgi:uncharacterized ParB-like nuclease family protein